MKQGTSGTKPPRERDAASTRGATTGPVIAAAELTRFPSLQIDHPLDVIFRDAVDQARKGKGDARHGRGTEFMKQTWLETSNAHGSAFLTGQAEKKLRESLALEYAHARSEMLGAMVYIAMAVIKLDRDHGLGPLPRNT